MLGARKNGLPCIGVLFGYGSRQELEAAGSGPDCHHGAGFEIHSGGMSIWRKLPALR